jgi:hypothetical protein
MERANTNWNVAKYLQCRQKAWFVRFVPATGTCDLKDHRRFLEIFISDERLSGGAFRLTAINKKSWSRWGTLVLVRQVKPACGVASVTSPGATTGSSAGSVPVA